MRMAMSCLAFPEAGQPNLRARRNSAAVDSGMPERSSLLSGIGFALLAGRLARADDADDFLAIFHLPGSVNERGIREIPHCAGRPLRPAKPSGTQKARRSEAGRENRPASLGPVKPSGMQTTHPAAASGTQNARMTMGGGWRPSQAAFWNLSLAV